MASIWVDERVWSLEWRRFLAIKRCGFLEGSTICGELCSAHELCPSMGWEGLLPLNDEALSSVVMAGTKGRPLQGPTRVPAPTAQPCLDAKRMMVKMGD